MFAKPRLFRKSVAFWYCKTNVRVLPIAVFGLVQTFIIFRPNSNMEAKSYTQKAEIERFRQLMMSNLTLVSGSEFENFLSVECD